MWYAGLCVNYCWTKCFKNCKNISTDGEVMVKIKVACFFLGHGVYILSLLCRPSQSMAVTCSAVCQMLPCPGCPYETLFWIPLYPLRQVPRLEFHRNPTVAALLSKGVSSNVVSFYIFASPTANRWQPVKPDVFFFYTSVLAPSCKTLNFYHILGWWRADGSRRRPVMTGLDGPSWRDVCQGSRLDGP